MQRRIFISYSTMNSSFVDRLISRLNSESYWIDKQMIDVGEVIHEKISEGIENCNDFILIWSKESSESRWVKLELGAALTRWIEEQNVKLRIICIDQTPLPILYKQFLFFNADSNENKDIEKIAKSFQDYSAEYIYKPKRSNFVNRSEEISSFEDAIYNDDVKQILITGIYGIGKYSLVKNALKSLFDNYEMLKIDLHVGFDELKLLFKLNSALNFGMPELFKTKEEILSAIAIKLEEVQKRNIFIVLKDIQYIIDSDGKPSKLLTWLMDYSSKRAYFSKCPLILTSTQNPKFPMEMIKSLARIKLHGLESKHTSRIIQNHLEAEDYYKKLSDSELEYLSKEINGYPLACNMIAGLVCQFDYKYLEENPIEINNMRIDIAKNLISKTKLSDEENLVLYSIALVDGVITATDISNVLKFDDELLHNALSKLTSVNLIFIEKGYLKLHNLIRDYFWRLAVQSKDYKDLISDFAKYYYSRIDYMKSNMTLFIEMVPVVFRLLALNGDIKLAMKIRPDLLSEIKRAAIELYQTQKYDLSTSYVDLYLEHDSNDWDMRLYRARLYVRSGDYETAEDLLLEMLKQNNKSVGVNHQLGKLLLKKENYEGALDYFRVALEGYEEHLPSLRESAECFIRLGRLPDAQSYISILKKLDSSNPYLFEIESRLMEELGDITSAHELMKIAVDQMPENSMFLHRFGSILEKMNNTDLAIEMYTRALDVVPNKMETKLSLASLLIDKNEFAEAKSILDNIQDKLYRDKRTVYNNILCKYYLRIDNIDEAKKCIPNYAKDSYSLGNLVLIHIKEANKNLNSDFVELAGISIKKAKVYLEELKQLNVTKNFTTEDYAEKIEELELKLEMLKKEL